MKRIIRNLFLVTVLALMPAATLPSNPVLAADDPPGTTADTAHQRALATLTALGATVSELPADGSEQRWMVSTAGAWQGGDDGLAHLAHVDGLVKLRLGGSITAAGLTHLSGLGELQSLDLHLPAVDDASLRHLVGLDRLERLNLTFTGVTDAGLGRLESLHRLRWLGVVHTAVTADGARRLQAALPGLIIQGSFSEPLDATDTAARYKYRWGEPGTGKGAFHAPTTISVFTDPRGRKLLVIADSGNHRIRHYTADGMFIDKWGEQGDGEGQFHTPVGLAVTPEGDLLVADAGNHRIQKTRIGTRSFLEAPGGFVGVVADAGDGLDHPAGLALSPDGELLVVDRGVAGLWRIDAGGAVTPWAEGVELADPVAVARGADGTVYVTDAGRHQVVRLSATGELLARWGGPGEGAGALREPRGVAVAADGTVWVVDSGHHRVVKFSADGQLLGSFGGRGSAPGELLDPWGVAVDGDGDLYVTDAGNGRIQVFAGGTGAPARADASAAR